MRLNINKKAITRIVGLGLFTVVISNGIVTTVQQVIKGVDNITDYIGNKWQIEQQYSNNKSRDLVNRMNGKYQDAEELKKYLDEEAAKERKFVGEYAGQPEKKDQEIGYGRK